MSLDGVPEWVKVWRWARNQGDTRQFPQQAVYGRDESMSVSAYEEVLAAWRAAGAPEARVLEPVLEEFDAFRKGAGVFGDVVAESEAKEA